MKILCGAFAAIPIVFASQAFAQTPSPGPSDQDRCNHPVRIVDFAPPVSFPPKGHGDTVIRLIIAQDGHIKEATIVQRTADAKADQEGLRMAQASKYAPAMKDCDPIEASFIFTASY